MKRFLMITTLIATTTGAAIAQDSAQLRNSVEVFLTESAFDVDVSTLTNEQVAKLYGAMTSSEKISEQTSAVRAVLAEENVMGMQNSGGIVVEGAVDTSTPLPRNQIFAEVSTALIGTQYEGRASELSEEELAIAYGVITSSETESAMANGLDGVFK